MRKLQQGGTFPVKRIQLNSGIELSSIEMSAQAPKSKPKSPPTSREGWKCSPEMLRGLFQLIPNEASIDREGEESWINIGHWAKGLCEDGREVFIDWTLTWKGTPGNLDKHTEESIGHSWDGFGNSGLLSQGGKLRALAERINPDRFRQWDARWAFDDNPEPPPPSPPSPPGPEKVQFQTSDAGQILYTMENAARAINGLGLVCSHDEFHHRIQLRRRCGKVEKLTDDTVLLLRVEINNAYGKDFGPVHIGDAVKALALRNGFNPVTDMLKGAELFWDGVKRLDRLGPDYFHTEDTELARACFRKVMIAAVRRARRPGCKFDQILVTESPEGWDKSSAWAVLAGAENFSDADILGKDARQVQEELADIWIHEIADLSGLSRADIEHVKAFASRTNDRARPAYGRYLIDQPRQSIEVGTTNADIYMMSQTGNRRFWPFELSAPVDLVQLREDRLMLWGEAAAAESAGETLVLDRHLWDEAGQEQEKRRVIDTWEDELANLPEERMQDWNGEQFISNLAVQEYLGGYRRQTFNSGSGRKIADIMRRLGWERCSRKMDGAMHRGYKRAKATTVSSSVSHLKPDNPF